MTPTAFCQLSTVALAVTAVFSTTALAESTYLQNVDKDAVFEVSESGAYWVNVAGAPKTITNNGTIQGNGIIQFNNGGVIVNNGLIDVKKLIYPEPTNWSPNGGARIENNADGRIVLSGEDFGVALNNHGKVIAKTGKLHFYNGYYEFYKDGSITKEDGTMLDEIAIKGTNHSAGNKVTIHEGATLEAHKIEIDGGAHVISGTLSADDLSISGSQIQLGSTGIIKGNEVSLGQVVALDDTGGGSITASKILRLTSNSQLKNVLVETPVITAERQIHIYGDTKVVGTKSVLLGLGGLLIEDNAQFDGDHLDQLTLRGMSAVTENGAEARVTLGGTHGLHIGQLTVNKSTDANGNVLENKLIDKMKVTEEGKTSFDVDSLTVAEGAALSIYADEKTVEDKNYKKTNLTIGTLNVGDKATVKLGYREGDYEAFSSKSIGHLVLGTESVVDGGTSDKSKFAEIGQITFDGTKAKLTSTLTGDATNVFMNAGATGNTLSAVETGKFNVTLEKTAKDSLHVTHTGDKTVVNVVATPENNSGDAQKDLNEIAQSVVFDDKKAHNVTQEADDMNDAFSGTVIDGKVGNVKVEANSNINGIAEMTAVGLHIWRNEINDMNKRLGELRDSSDDANGVWARVYNGKAKFGDQKITNKYTAFQFGYDRQVADSLWLGGAMSWTDGDSDFAVGGGDNSLMALTAYGSKLWDNGMFVDVTGKFGRIKNEFDIRLANGRSNADYDANAVSVSAEAGWRVYPLNNGFFVEPQVEMMYGRVESVDYTTSTGVKVNQDSAETLIGRAGFVMGLKCPADRGNAYVRASVLHDWEGDANFKFSKDGVNSRAISESLGGTWYEYGIGANFNATKQLHIYADVEAANGGEVDTDYRVNFGMRYSF